MRGLAAQLNEHLRYHEDEWHHKGGLLRMEWRHKNNQTLYMSETVGRTLRTLEANKIIAVKPDDNNKSVLYKWLPFAKRETYIPWSERPDGAKRTLFSQTKHIDI